MCDKNVYVGSMSFEYVNIYSIGMNIPTLYDFPNYHKNRLEFLENRENEVLRENNKKFGAYGEIIADLNSQFNKYEILPDSLWITSNKNPLPKNEEYIFQVLIGGIILREPCAKILKQFNLGQTTLTPLKIYEYETGELWSDEIFYFLNLCEHRKYFCHPPSNTDLFKKVFDIYRDDIYMAYDTVRDHQVEIDKSALQSDIDFWYDPRISMYFMSDKLYTALEYAGMAYQWNMKSCKLI